MKTLKKNSSWRNSANIFKLIILVALVISILGPAQISAAAASAANTVKPGQSIQSALDALAPGGTLNIIPGTYTESLSISTSNITLRKAPNTAGEVVINGDGADYTISLSSAPNTVLDSLTVTNANFTDISAVDSDNCKVLNCKIREWALVGFSTTASNRAGIYMENSSNWLIAGNLMNRGNHDGPQVDSEYDDPHDISGILVMGGSGGHRVLNNVFYGAYQSGGSWRFSLNDFLSNDDWNQPNDAWNNSTISGNQFYGSFDDVMQFDGNNNNLTISNNFIDGKGCRALISINPCYNGPVYIKNNILKDWDAGEVGFKMGAFTGSANGTKYITGNIGWSTGGTFMGGTNGPADNVHFLNNKLNVPKIEYSVSFARDSGNTNSNFSEPTLADWKRRTSALISNP